MSSLKIERQLLPDVYLLKTPFFRDSRGSFSKIFHFESFSDQSINFEPKEIFFSTSAKYVLRGMHFQIGNAAHQKLVCCQKGKVLDIIVCVDPNSDHFNKPIAVELDEESSTAILIGTQYAHGFLSLEDDSLMLYSTSTVHCPELDKGILWSSIDFEWPTNILPILSERDKNHPHINTLQ